MNDDSNPASTSGQAECYLVVYNVAKKHNIGTLARSATAFNVTKICLVGSRHYNTFGGHGSAAHVELAYFPTLQDCCSWLKQAKDCEIIGVEITETALAVNRQPFSGNTAFMLGNEGSGLSDSQLKLCDKFVYIPQHGQGTASLNVTVAASIVLHHFAIWAGYNESSRQGAKFDVAPPPPRTAPRGQVPLSAEEAKDLQEARQTGLNQDWLMEQSADDKDVSDSHTADLEGSGVLNGIFNQRSTCCGHPCNPMGL